MLFRQRALRRFVAAGVLASFSAACYVQRPMMTSVPGPTTRIVAQVTDTGSVLMANSLGPAATEVEAIVTEATGDSWTLQMLRVNQRGGFSSRWNRETVTFPRIALTGVTEKVLDKKRSWLLAGMMTAIVLGSTLFFGSILGGENTDPPTPPPV